ncbi:response regulator [Rickettsiales bacterium LUAb2]
MELSNKFYKSWVVLLAVSTLVLILLVITSILSILYFLPTSYTYVLHNGIITRHAMPSIIMFLWAFMLIVPPIWWYLLVKQFKKNNHFKQSSIRDENNSLLINNDLLNINKSDQQVINNDTNNFFDLNPNAHSLVKLNNQNDYIENLQQFINNIFFGVIATNNNGKIIAFNTEAEKLLNLQPNINKNFSDFITEINPIVVDDFVLIKAELSISNNHKQTFNILQNNFIDQTSNEEYVLLMLLPEHNMFAKSIDNTIKDLPHISNTKEINTQENNINKASKAKIKELSLIQTDLFSNDETILLQDLTENIGIGLIVLNEQKEIILCNKEALNLLDLTNNITGNSFIEIMQNNFPNLNLESINNNSPIKVSFINKSMQYIELYAVNIGNDKLVTFTNISDKKDLEKQITFSQRLQTIGQIASAVAHDFNNLLTAIMSFAYFLRERYTEDDPSTVELEQIQQNANRAKVMIRQLLTFSRGQELNPVSFEVNSEISNLMSTILRLMGEKIKAEFIRGKGIGKTMMDPVQFHQIIINIIVNARDAMKKGGKLQIATELVEVKNPIEGIIATIPSGNYILVTIEDEGEGIKEENLRKIFQIHFSTKGEKGNGLGLATVAKILQENAGFINVKSMINKGTTFYLYLQPHHAKNDVDTVVAVHNETIIDLTGNGIILLVEDEIPVRMVCKRILQSKGYKVLEAEDAETALSLLQKVENKVDLVISDIMMPGMSGPEFIAKVRENNPKIKAILMSGYAEDVLDDKDYVLDHVDFLSKPFSPDVLATKVKKAITK